MVQLKRDLPQRTRDAPDNTYWAVGDDVWDVQRQEQGFRKKKYVNLISGPVTARIVTDRANRKERGLLNYENCSMDELEAFIEARHLIPPDENTYNIQGQTTKVIFRDTKDRQLRMQKWNEKVEARRAGAKKAAYIAVLQEADDNIVLDKFPTLIAELRTTVYKMYFDDLPALPKLPYQPPLTLVTKGLRKETLPLFYEQSTFILRLRVRTQNERSTASLHNTAIDPDLLMSANLPPASLARISRISLHISHHRTYRPPGWSGTLDDDEDMSWEIDLDGKAGVVIDGDGFFDDYGDETWWVVRRGRMEAAILRVLRDVAARSKAHRLRPGDLEDLREAVQGALNLPVDG
ncbi:hypothetical protein MBLNU13_g06885t1 [Cladosporium sp. NU13]